MPKPRLVIELLAKRHQRASFSCGVEDLDDYLKKRAGQEARKNLAATRVATYEGSDDVLGYYTLSSTSIVISSLPAEQAKGVPYNVVPGALIGRIAVSQTAAGQGLGTHLLIDALRTLVKVETLAFMVIVIDPKTDRNSTFYQAFGFKPLDDDPTRLFMSKKEAAKIVAPTA